MAVVLIIYYLIVNCFKSVIKIVLAVFFKVYIFFFFLTVLNYLQKLIINFPMFEFNLLLKK